MKTAQINEYGDASAVNVVDADQPIASDGQVLVKVNASSLNPVDSAIRSGYFHQMMPVQFPATLGGDIAGEVVEVGNGVEGFAVGDKVYGQAAVIAGNSGAFAEYAATNAGQLAKAPENISLNEAASLPLVGVSALQALTQHINLQPGQKILITGGAGGIGRIAIQIAKNIGAHVATTVTGEGISAAKSLGADEAIDYKSQDFAEVLSDYDAVFDTVGGEEFAKTLTVLKKGGVAVTMAAQPDQAQAEELGVTAVQQMTQVTSEALSQLRELVESGVVKPQVGKVFSLDEIQEAFTARESGTVSGKVVLEISK
ncbi:MAG TPA: NADP-dependent oxidoreductase [Candidatus Saccharimonadales bacterium]|nr:NADP-dependent oxidoreductase [Candidatus Saccharimonadales bacterium]